MGLKMMVPDEAVRKGTEFGGLWSSRGEDWGGWGKHTGPKIFKSSGSQ